MYYKKGDKVRLLRNIYRDRSNLPQGAWENVLYAKKGLEGEIVEIFTSDPGNFLGTPRVNAKILSDGRIYTFRLTSITKI